MHPIIRNILAGILGWLGGSAINMGLVQIGHKVLPIQGIDPNDMSALAAVMPSLDTEYFIFPFLAHALGTMVGAMIAYLLAASHKMKFAFGIGAFFLLGGLAVNYMLPGPLWFAVVDILIVYIPMAWLGGIIAQKLQG